MRISLLCTLFVPLLSLAQTQSQLTGTITDNTGAVVVGASVIGHNTDTGGQYKGASNENGVYLLPFLPPGRYELTCELAGFKKFVRSGLVLETGLAATVDVQLQVGQITESVGGQALIELIEDETARRGA